MNEPKTSKKLPLGKLPPAMLQQIIANAPISDPRVLLGPGVGIDCAVIDIGSSLLVLKTDPITFATDEIGWYCVQICANDIATTGATPRWMLSTLMLPENSTEKEVFDITDQINRACKAMNISLIGGHTEVTHGINHPILTGTMIGEVDRASLITQQGAKAGDMILLTKGIPYEAAALLAREFPHLLESILTKEELLKAADFLYHPGISITRDSQIARSAGHVTSMHDPTEGGLAAALWELSQASHASLVINKNDIPIPDIPGRICAHFSLDPLSTIASGALLMTVEAEDADKICGALQEEGITCAIIGQVSDDPEGVWDISSGKRNRLPYPERDEIARFYEEHA
ncbi:MAG: AIR synthase family protein [Anaerolineaceae bacterium]|nr:AIR synthase family protein [Anaerolineaceae bacterium]